MDKRLCALSAGCLAAALALATPAQAGIFDSIFGGLRRAVEPPPAVQAYAPPAQANVEPAKPAYAPPAAHAARSDNGPAVAFCVRTCDGHFFPVRAHPGLSTAQACRAFCPASETRLYSGSSIDHAVATDGSRYSALPNAFVYRKQLVAGCTCNGRDAFGLAHIDAKADPTLKPGDVVVTRTGLVAYSGKSTEFTPVRDFAGFSKSTRDQLSAMPIMRPNPGAAAPAVSSIAPSHDATRVERRVENDR